jgi:hypothetical protein
MRFNGFSASAMYLRPVMRSDAGKRLTVLPDTTVTRVLFDGRQAVGVQYQALEGLQIVRVKREVKVKGRIF